LIGIRLFSLSGRGIEMASNMSTSSVPVRWAFIVGAALYGFWALMMIFIPSQGHVLMSATHPFNPAAIRMFGAALVGNAVLLWAGRGNAGLVGLGTIGSGAISLLALYNLAIGDFTRGFAMYISTALSVAVTVLLATGRR
jgi:hypothetical protein